MDFDLKEVLNTTGPSASIVFAVWIFLQLLNMRYQGAYDRYRNLIEAYREGDGDDQRRRSIRDQVVMYRHRCEQMRMATNIGVIAAMLLVLALVTGTLNIAFSQLAFFKWICLVCSVIGLLLLITAACVVLIENTELQNAIDSELSDQPDLQRAVAQKHNSRSGSQSGKSVQA